jgi:patatin-like phospholipase/acyl hydrolase
MCDFYLSLVRIYFILFWFSLGGGMRGAVSAGMAAAIAGLGLTDAFDVIYGSSAGSVIGAYMVR